MLPLAAIAMIGSTIIQGAGSIMSGRAQRKASEQSAKLAEMNAQRGLREAGEAESRQRRMGRRALATQRTAVSQSGFSMSGSMLDWLEESATMAELDALNIRYEGQARADSQRVGTQMDLAQGRDAQTAGYIGAGANLLQGAAQYGQYKLARG